MTKSRIETEEVIITETKEGIIHVHFKEGLEITVELQGRLYDMYEEICDGDKKPFLFTADEGVSVTKEARINALIMEQLFPGSASAVLVSSTPYKAIANFYLLVSKPRTPYQVFTNKEKAVEWLQGFLEIK